MAQFVGCREPDMVHHFTILPEHTDKDFEHLLETCEGKIFYDPYFMVFESGKGVVRQRLYFSDEQAAIIFKMFFG